MLTLSKALDRATRLYGNRTAIIEGSNSLTWTEYGDRVKRAAGILKSLGVNRGERFGIICHNSFRQSELFNAGYWIGAVPVPVNYRLAPPEIRYILEDADCRILAVGEAFTGLLESDDLSAWKDKAFLISSEDASVGIPVYETMLQGAGPEPMYKSLPEDDAILLYTGGTTGRSKGVRLSHGNIIANALQIGLTISARENDRFLHLLPMFHSADLFGTIFTLVGGVHVYVREFTPKILLQAVHDHGITVLSLGPTVIIMTLQDPEFDQYDCTSLRLVFYGSAPMAVEWIKRAREKFPNAGLQQGYGLTETSPILTTFTPEQLEHAIAAENYDAIRSVGKPLVLIDLRIVDEYGNEMPAGEVGEVIVRGPNVTCGYLGLEEQNKRTFRDGWFHTGDVGYLDEDNNLYLKDRMKDMIITGGENVYSSEVESVLYRHPDIHEAAVVGIPDEKWGEAVFAVIVPAPGKKPAREDIIEHCRKYIGGFKIPRRMAFMQELPKSAMGKVLKTELRRMYSPEKQTEN